MSGHHLNADIGIIACNDPHVILAVAYYVPGQRLGIILAWMLMISYPLKYAAIIC